MAVGRRFNLDLDSLVDFQSSDVNDDFFEMAEAEAVEFVMTSDYFIFRRNEFPKLPPFAVGRPYWDNWMVYAGRMASLPVVDVTQAVFAVHQNHGHAHIQQVREREYYGPEGDQNLELLGIENAFSLHDVTQIMDPENVLHSVKGDEYLKRKIRTLPILKPRKGVAKKWQEFIQRFLMALYFRRKKIPYRLFEYAVNNLEKLC